MPRIQGYQADRRRLCGGTSRHRRRAAQAAFTLVELLVVIGILSLLLAVLVPALGDARRRAKNVVCQANLKGLMTGVTAYASANNDHVVPSYNMRRTIAGRSNPLDGWGPILDRDGFLSGSDNLGNNPFVCPSTLDEQGLRSTQRGSHQDVPEGYVDWPAVLTFSSVYAKTLPRRGFDRIVRVSYWINGDNPIGQVTATVPRIFFTASVGYGPDTNGETIKANQFADFPNPARLVALADGIFSGMQQATRPEDAKRRIGYRHRTGAISANVGFADGHVEPINGDRFPRALAKGLDHATIRDENLGSGPTLYSDPRKQLVIDPGSGR